ncbi:MAG: hypothetical protein CMH54_10460 [Myxococcales bacterium]|nr:hypothetical protein [Myxococcales bacterium]
MKKFFSLLLFCLFLLGSTLSATAYISLKNQGGAETTWAKTNVPWYLNPTPVPGITYDDMRDAIHAAFDAWENVSCSGQSFSYMSPSSNPQNGAIYVEATNGEWDPSVGDAAAFTVSEKKWNGEIKYSIIVFNGVDISWTTSSSASLYGYKTDIQGVATHEIGHALGLDHPHVREATMFFSGGSSELRSLDNDDVKGVCYLYPTGSFTTGTVCDSCSGHSNCKDNVCLSFPWEYNAAFCGQSCNTGTDCPKGFSCENVADAGNQCVPTHDYCSPSGGNIPMGEYCWGPGMCNSGICIPTAGDAYCTQQCNTANPNSCPANYACYGGGTSEGICFKKGSKQFGEECTAPLECASTDCFSGQCSSLCDTDDDCFGSNICAVGHCIPPGPFFYGEPCDSHLDCSTGYCATGFDRYCSEECTTTSECPPGASCIFGGYCEKLSFSAEGEVCQADGDCAPGLDCIQDTPAGFGECRQICDPINDAGCQAGKVCLWFFEPADQKIVGGCVEDTGGASVGGVCGGGAGNCQPHLICATITGPTGTCVRDCRVSDSAGCDPSAGCVSLNDTSDPFHGACIDGMGNPPPPDTGGDDTGTTPQPDTTNSADLGTTPIPPVGSSSGGGCNAGTSNSFPTHLWFLLTGLLVLYFRRRRLEI